MADDDGNVTFENEVRRTRELVEQLKRVQTAFQNSYSGLGPKERSIAIREILNIHKHIVSFLEKARKEFSPNAGVKFSIENIKATFGTLRAQWKKLETKLEESVGSGSFLKKDLTPPPVNTNIDLAESAAQQYVKLLGNSHGPIEESWIASVKSKVSSAIETQTKKTGTAPTQVIVYNDNGKIKVKLV